MLRTKLSDGWTHFKIGCVPHLNEPLIMRANPPTIRGSIKLYQRGSNFNKVFFIVDEGREDQTTTMIMAQQ